MGPNAQSPAGVIEAKRSKLFVGLLVLCGAWLPSCGAESGGGPYRLNSEVPGTEVFLRGEFLGVVPLELTVGDLSSLGLTPPMGMDGYCEGWFFGEEDESEIKLMFLVPEADRDDYLSIETPWGLRTKTGGARGDLSQDVTIGHMKRVNSDGLELLIEVPSRASRSAGTVHARAVLTSTSGSELGGVAPELVVQWGTFDTPWRRRTRLELPLDETWSVVSPGERLEIEFDLPVPTVAEDYSVFSLFHLMQDDDSGYLAGSGAVYSNSELLRVR